MSAVGGAPLPDALADAVEARVRDRAPRELAAAAAALSTRYRDGTPAPLPDPADLDVDAYLTVRLPATFAAVHRALTLAAVAAPDLTPRRLLDVGTGPGTAVWAATAVWPSIDDVTAVEPAARFRSAAAALAVDGPPALRAAAWRPDLAAASGHDLVTATYVLGELDDPTAAAVGLWERTSAVLALVEPGTPDAAARLGEVRAALVDLGAHVVFPCPHDGPCPYVVGEVPAGAPGWCHASVRVARSRRHRLAKGGAAPFEDERFTALVVSRAPVASRRPAARLLDAPSRKGRAMELAACTPDGVRRVRLPSPSPAMRRARWGDGIDLPDR